MSRKLRKVQERVDLENDGIMSVALQDTVHDRPQEVHYERAAGICGLELAQMPVFETVADLIAFVISVRAAGGDDKSIQLLVDRFSPKATRSTVDVNANQDGGMPISSNSPEEQAISENYMTSLNGGKK